MYGKFICLFVCLHVCRMLDEHFEDQMNDIISQCPKGRQTMLFSATMTDQVSFVIVWAHLSLHI